MENTRKSLMRALFGIALACVIGVCCAMIQPANAHAVSYGTKSNPEVITKSGTTINCPAGSGSAYYLIKTSETMAVKLTHTNVAFLQCFPAAEPADDPDSAYIIDSGNGTSRSDIVYIPKNKGNGVMIKFDRIYDATLKVEFENYDFGSIAVNLAGGSKMNAGTTKSYTATYTRGKNFGKENDSYLSMVNGESTNIAKTASFKGTFTAKVAGYTNMSFAMRSKSERGYATQTIKYVPVIVMPAKPAAPSKDGISGNSKMLQIVLPATAANGNNLTLQMKNGSVWKDVKTVAVNNGVVTVTGLSAKKAYTFRYYGSCPAQGAGKPALVSDYSQEFSATTAPSGKPKIKSIKVTKAKESYHPSVYHSGHWVGSTWYSGWSSPAYYTTTYTIKVKLSKSIKGATGISVNGNWISGKGKTFTAKITDQGRCKGKSKRFTVKAGTSNRILGTGATKKAKIA